MWVLNYGTDRTGPQMGNIHLYDFDIGVYRLLDPNQPSNMSQMGTWKLLIAILQTHFGLSNQSVVDPLVLDLDGDGLELTARSSISPLYDIDGDFYGEHSGWVRPDDGILVHDLNGNGTIDDVTEMFGGATSGFAALAALTRRCNVSTKFTNRRYRIGAC